ncbi:MAG: GGDEF domain-containing protein [Candidatus Yanofskybacteria bacterium]|nr:GGDEF domain-containing protein [Candidatus Yanofskybacteria bacterium]
MTIDTEKKIEELEAEIERLKREVFYDGLTSLLNRRGFEKETSGIFEIISFHKDNKERRAGFKDLSILFIDLDNFKQVNDIFGHQMGDEVLKKTAQVLKRSVRTNDLVGRWGGEEMVVGLVGASINVAKRIAEEIRVAIEKMKIKLSETPIPTTASIGVAHYTEEKTLLELIEKADRAMYEAKQAGKNRVVVLE